MSHCGFGLVEMTNSPSTEIATNAEAAFKSISELVPDAMKRHQVPGLAFGILADGREFTAGFGVTNVRHPLPVDDRTTFQIGSITKTFTATLATRLVEAGKLDLDAPIRRYLPRFRMSDPEVTEHVTMRHLLTHMGGWEGDFFEDTGNGDDALTTYVERMAELPQLTPLGSVWAYSNSGFSLAGRVIEVLNGTTYEAALKQQVFEPLGMKRSFIFPAEVMTHRFAVGHAAADGRQRVLRPWPISRGSYPAGGIASTVTDMMRYARFHLGDDSIDGARVLSKDYIRLMQKEIVPTQLGAKIGLSWGLQDLGGLRFVAHGGGTLGQISTFVMVPERRFAIVVVTNSGSGGLAGNDVILRAYEDILGVTVSDPKPITIEPAALAEYAGRYRATLTDIEIRLESDHLIMEVISRGGFPKRDSRPGPSQPPTRIVFTGRDQVLALDPPFEHAQAEFLRGAKGEIEWLRYGRIHRRL
jgi:CubicO group peptidase (beta-lactamase class C family)